MPRLSAVSTITLGLSTWHVITSTPWSTRLLVASASFTGSDQSPVTMNWHVIVGSTLRAPSRNALALRSTYGIGFAATNPNSFDLGVGPATMPPGDWHASV